MKRFVVLALVFVIALLATRPALAEPIRILVAAGSKTGLPAERPLKFADNDARRVREVMVALGGVRAEDAAYLGEPTRSGLFAAIERAKKTAAGHRPEEVTLVFYFSGHGDRDAIHLGGERVLLAEITTKLAEVPAALRIAVTDACRATREKGFTADAPFAISAALVPQASGQVWIHASSDGEAAQESDELQGAIFTNAWLTGLRGAADANGDARVTLEESFAFAHSQTLIRSAKSSGVMQKPEAVLSLKEAAPVVITQTTAKVATISLPAGRDVHFLVSSASAKSVVSELWSSPERPLRLRVPPGRYLVLRRTSGLGDAADVVVAEGEERRLEDRDFTASRLEPVARKGDADVLESPPPKLTGHELAAGYDLGTSSRAGMVHGPRVSYAYAWPRFAIALGGGADFASRSVDGTEERLTGGYVRGGAEWRLPLSSALVFRAGGGLRAGLLFQSLATNRPFEPPSSDRRTALVVGPEATLGLRLALGRSWFVDLGASGGLGFFRQSGALRGIAAVTGTSGVGAHF